METTVSRAVSQEREGFALGGWVVLLVNLALLFGSIGLIFMGVAHASTVLIICCVLMILVAVILFCGYFTLQPNEARVLVLFGEYRGTVSRSGFFWANPFYSRYFGTLQSLVGTKVSLRAQTLNGDKLKVNDKGGNPIEIAGIVIWRVADTAKALFDVESYSEYVRIQADSSLRHLASLYAYDHGEEHEPTLRSSVDEVSEALKKELQTRLQKAGIVVEETRLMHLAYAPEIAQAMLRRQQAEAVIAARKMIVHGAVSMVQLALQELSEKNVVVLDEERKAAMVSNLLVVLCGETEVSPVVNAGTLY